MNKDAKTLSKNDVSGTGKEDLLFYTAKELKKAEDNRQSKHIDNAISICRSLLKRFPDYVGALHTLGISLADADQYEEAITVLSKASVLCPQDWRIHTALSGVSLKLGMPKTAMNALDLARKIKGEDINILGTLAELYRNQKEYELAADTFEKMLGIDGSIHEAKFLLADCYEHLGRLGDIPHLYESVINIDKYRMAAISGLSHLPKSIYSFGDWNVIDKLNFDEEKDHERIYFMLAQRFHHSSNFLESWNHLIKANKKKRLELSSEARSAHNHNKELLKFVNGVPGGRDATNPPKGMPISLFILGASRSGKTTLEYLLGKVPGVKRGYENPIVANAVVSTLQTSGCITRTSINGMPPGLDPVFIEFYKNELLERAGEARVFTNTHPGKIGQAPRYGKTIPGSRFIFIKRNFEDIAVRMYMKNYESGNSWAYDIKDIFGYINWYNAMIESCSRKLKNISLVVNYEDMIADPAAVAKRACALCGIEAPVDFTSVSLGDDRGIAQPYVEYIRAALSGRNI